MNVIDIKDQEDGSAILSVDLSPDEIMALAKIGLLKVLTDAAEATIDEHKE